jgi:hypothetical protein
MSAPIAAPNSFANRGYERILTLRRSRRARKVALVLGSLLTLYALVGFFAVPALLRHWVDTRAAALLGRPVSVGALRFNPFSLKLDADQVHVGEADGRTPFVDIDTLTVNGSWTSLFRIAPVLDELNVQRPRIAISRSAAQRFNFSDLIERFVGAPASPNGKPEPARFSLSNITVHEGDIRFDDKVSNASHQVENIEIGIPFIANLPRDTEVFVQPLLAMRVDGRPLRIEGRTKPFASSLESTIDFHLDRLDLPLYLGYVPAELPVAIPRGLLSGDLQLRFVESKTAPQLSVSGLLVLDDFALTDKNRAPIAEVGRAMAALTDVQPLISRYRLGAVQLDQASLHYTQQAGGHSNFDALLRGGAKPTASKVPLTEIAIADLALDTSRFEYIDNTGAAPATLTIDALNGSVTGLNTRAGPAAAVDVAGHLNGGSLTTRGKLDLPASRYLGTLSTKNIGLAPLQALAAPNLNASIQQGRLDTDGSFVSDWRSIFNLHIEPATASLRDVAIGARASKDTLIAWSALDVALTRFDLAASEVQHGDVVVHGLMLNAQRSREGKLDLAGLADTSTPAGAKRAPIKGAAPVATWRWSVARLGIDNATLSLQDLSSRKPTTTVVKAINGEVGGLSEQMSQPLKITLSGSIDKGGFDVGGNVRPAPLNAELKIKTRQLELAGFMPYVEVPLNVSVTQAQLSSDGALRYAAGTPTKLTYRGRAALGRVRVLDKLSGDDFLSFRALDIGSIDLRSGEGPLHLSLGNIALSDFYARVIMNASGRLNLSEVAGSGAVQPVSVTRAEDASTPATPAPALVTSAVPAPVIQVGQITLARGRLNYTDNFIKPNYSANITQLTGKVGAFGSAGGPPAEVTVQGELDDNAQVNIDGSINPLAPITFVDIKGKANGVELTHLSAYSSKYTGYPIEKGRLSADVSYLLDQGKLKADNHIFIDQLTFGERVESPGASHLPVKLAVALLKNARGEIDVNVPVSGSLEDPQFSLGGVILRAFVGLIGKAVTSPFRLLASAFSGGDSGQDLGYVEFAPGAATLDDAARARLAKIVTALTDRPAVNLDISGRVDPAHDEVGLRKVMVDDLIRKEYADDHAEKNGGEHADEQDESGTASPPLSPEDTERYLERAYKHAEFPKPKNLIGLTASQPPEEMRKMLETNMAVDADALRHLAERRASAVRHWLHGKIDDKRLFLLAPKLDAKGIDDQGKTTRVDFGLH